MANEELEENNKQEDSSELELVEIEETEATNTENIDDSNAVEESDDDTQEYEVQQKLTKIQKILIGVVGFLFLIVLVGAILYFMGYFDPEPIKVTKTKIQTEIKKNKKYQFKASDINENRINRKLSLLTKYELVLPETSKKEQETTKEDTNTTTVDTKAKNDTEIKEKEVKEEEIKEQEIKKEDTTSTTIDTKNKIAKNDTQIKEKETKEPETKKEDSNTTIVDTKANTKDEIKKKIPQYKGEEFLKFIQVATLKYKLYKSFINQVKAIDARISICAYKKNKTQIFIGPFNDEEKRNSLVKKINKSVVNDAFKVEFTKEEFNKRCNF